MHWASLIFPPFSCRALLAFVQILLARNTRNRASATASANIVWDRVELIVVYRRLNRS
jgi:DNA-binding response OmpR family regulator